MFFTFVTKCLCSTCPTSSMVYGIICCLCSVCVCVFCFLSFVVAAAVVVVDVVSLCILLRIFNLAHRRRRRTVPRFVAHSSADVPFLDAISFQRNDCVGLRACAPQLCFPIAAPFARINTFNRPRSNSSSSALSISPSLSLSLSLWPYLRPLCRNVAQSCLVYRG